MSTCLITGGAGNLACQLSGVLSGSCEQDRVRGWHAMTVTPRDIAEAILRCLPAADLSFDPDPVIADLIASWPGAMDDSRARADWGWKPQFDLGQTADHLLDEIRREPL